MVQFESTGRAGSAHVASAFPGTACNITDMAWIGILGSKAVAGVGMGVCMSGCHRDSALLPVWADR